MRAAHSTTFALCALLNPDRLVMTRLCSYYRPIYAWEGGFCRNSTEVHVHHVFHDLENNSADLNANSVSVLPLGIHLVFYRVINTLYTCA